jgi:hypothetical protein
LRVLGITYNKQGALQIVGLAITQEVANYNNGEHKQYNHENLEVKVHVFAESPSHYNDEGGVE